MYLNTVISKHIFIKKNMALINIIFSNSFFFKFYCKNIVNSIFFKNINILYFYTLKKLLYVGKTYSFLIKNIKINFFFNRSHINVLYFKNFFKIKKLKKNKLRFVFLNYNDVNFFKKYVYKIRKLNFFTKRGLKISKSLMFKKKGKISAYR